MLTAPAHIRGTMPPTTPAHLLAERFAWVTEQLANNLPVRDIAQALGIRCATVHRIAGYKKTRNKPHPSMTVNSRGIRIGNIGSELLSLPVQTYDRLEARCARTGETLAEALVSFWVEAAA